MNDSAPDADMALPRRIWEELERALTDGGHPWRTPVLATVDDDGLPRARTVVLRGVDVFDRRLCFYTDARSPKVHQLRGNPRATLVMWSPELGWQLRLLCVAGVAAEGGEVEAAWKRVADTPAASDYLAATVPGSPLAESPGSRSAAHHLAIVTLEVETIDWLALDPGGHRRAIIRGESLTWVVP